MFATLVRIAVAFIMWVLISAMFHSLILSVIVFFIGIGYIVTGGGNNDKQ